MLKLNSPHLSKRFTLPKVLAYFCVTVFFIFKITPEASADENAWSTHLWYQVQPGESVTQILKKLGLCGREFGDCKTLVQTTESLNPDELHQKGNHLYQFAKLILPVTALPPQSKYSALSNREVVLTPIAVAETKPLEPIAAEPVVTEVSPLSRNLASEDPDPAATPPVPISEVLTDHAFGIFSMELGFASTRISATENANGSSSTLLTKSNTQEKFTYTQHWSKNFETSVYFGLDNLSINAPQNGGTIDDTNPTLHHFGITSRWQVRPKLQLGFGLGMDQDAFLVGASQTSINLDLVYVPTLNVFGAYDFYENGPFTLGASLGLGLSAKTLASGYQSSWNPGYQANIYLKQKVFSWLRLETGVRADYLDQNTSISSQAQSDLGVYSKLNFPLGGSFK
jgi:hypothetical protein